MAIEVRGTEEMVEEYVGSLNSGISTEEEEAARSRDLFNSSLAGHIWYIYQENKDSRRDSGIEQEMIESLEAFNGEYSSRDMALMTGDNGSRIFMNITATKCRACSSWIKDIIMPATDKAWRLSPSADPEIDPFLMDQIESILRKQYADFERQQAEEERKEQEPPQAPPQQAPPQEAAQGPPPPGPQQPPAGGQPQLQGEPKEQPTPPVKIATRLREMNRAKRDIEETFLKEVEMISRNEMKRFERLIEDQLTEGSWEKALSEFVEDFTVYPCAFLKGPILTKDTKMTYVDGEPQEEEKIIFMNKRINPLDMYPSANATEIDDGDLIEHIRFHRSEIANLKGLPGYNDANIEQVLETYQGSDFTSWLWTDIESDKAYLEKRGNEFQANRNIIHGLHFFGRASVRMLRDWGLPAEQLEGLSLTDEVEVEALLVDSVVIKASINKDPLQRRPYYKASFQNRPGSFWGRSLPHLMRDIQRMCNGTARALANNMGLASGPQVEIYTDRLADKGEIEQIYPMKIWQLTSDPTGAGGRAIQFTQPSSNAAELLSVYKEFELRADDATGIPRYAYGNERTGGAAQTASGLSMLLESASKGIKDAIRHIDEGLTKPRIAYQFYWNMKSDKDLKYTGDIQVVPIGSAALTMKAAEQAKRLELMQTLSGNPAVLEVVGPEAMAEIFRTLFEDANMGEIAMPSRLEIRQMSKEKSESDAKNQQMVMEMENKKIDNGLQATKEQIGGQERMHTETLKLKEKELQLNQEDSLANSIDRGRDLESRERVASQRALTDAERSKADRDFNDIAQRRQLAFDLQDLDEEKGPTEGKMNV